MLRIAYVTAFCGIAAVWAQQPIKPAQAVPHLIKFSGSLAEAGAKPLTGVVGVTFALYEEESGGSPLWMETQNVQADDSGHYTAMLGATSNEGISAEIFASGGRWLAVQPQGKPERPRVLMVSVPYALKAADAETLGGLPASAFALAGTVAESRTVDVPASAMVSAGSAAHMAPDLSGSGTTDRIAYWTNSSTLGTSALVQKSGQIGLGTSTPGTKLEVDTSTNTAILGNATATTGNFNGVNGQTASSAANGVFGNNLATSGDAIGVSGTSSSSTGKGVYGSVNATNGSGVSGNNSATSGFALGVNGSTNSSIGVGVNGLNNATSGFAPGVQGTSLSPSGAGVFGTNQNTSGSTVGVEGTAQSPNGQAVFAVNTATSGNATGVTGQSFSTSGIGVYGTVDATSGNAILGINSATSGFANGVSGSAFSPGGNGVFGANSSSAGGVGVNGQSNSSGGIGVYGTNNATTGGGYGVDGVVYSAGARGVVGINEAVSGVALAGINSTCNSSGCTNISGIAGQFITGPGGTVLQGLNGSNQVFSVDSHGNGTFAGNVSISGNLQVTGTSPGGSSTIYNANDWSNGTAQAISVNPSYTVVASLSLPAGNYWIHGVVNVLNADSGTDAEVVCQIPQISGAISSVDLNTDNSQVGAFEAELPVQGIISLSGTTTIQLSCSYAPSGDVYAYRPQLMAIQVTSIISQ